MADKKSKIQQQKNQDQIENEKPIQNTEMAEEVRERLNEDQL